MSDSRPEYSTTIGPDAKFKGELQFEKGVRLMGMFEGQISTEGSLVVDQGAKLSGEVSAGSIQVNGDVQGNILAGGKVQLSESGRLEGDIEASKLEVSEGAILIGRCVVGANGNAKQNATGGKPAKPAAAAAPKK